MYYMHLFLISTQILSGALSNQDLRRTRTGGGSVREGNTRPLIHGSRREAFPSIHSHALTRRCFQTNGTALGYDLARLDSCCVHRVEGSTQSTTTSKTGEVKSHTAVTAKSALIGKPSQSTDMQGEAGIYYSGTCARLRRTRYGARYEETVGAHSTRLCLD